MPPPPHPPPRFVSEGASVSELVILEQFIAFLWHWQIEDARAIVWPFGDRHFSPAATSTTTHSEWSMTGAPGPPLPNHLPILSPNTREAITAN